LCYHNSGSDDSDIDTDDNDDRTLVGYVSDDYHNYIMLMKGG